MLRDRNLHGILAAWRTLSVPPDQQDTTDPARRITSPRLLHIGIFLDPKLLDQPPFLDAFAYTCELGALASSCLGGCYTPFMGGSKSNRRCI
jgi:hypothetical protein